MVSVQGWERGDRRPGVGSVRRDRVARAERAPPPPALGPGRLLHLWDGTARGRAELGPDAGSESPKALSPAGGLLGTR